MVFITFQVVFLVTLALAFAQENSEVKVPYPIPPAYSSSLHTFEPVLQRLIPKEYNVEVKNYQVKFAKNLSKQFFNVPVPNARSKRSPQQQAVAVPPMPAMPAEEFKPVKVVTPSAEVDD
jgi:hypothetical protein